MELAEQKCIPCEGGVAPIQGEDLKILLTQTPEWEAKGDHIERTLKFPNFVEAMRFANRITKIAEEENHHPDLHISWGKITIELSTHAIGGLSINDFILAAKINKLYEENSPAQAI